MTGTGTLSRGARRRWLVTIAGAAASGVFATAALAAPPRPALDVYFLVDATASMWSVRPALARAVDQVVGRLRTRTTLRWGLAEFRDADLQTLVAHGPAYEQHAPVRPGGGDLDDIFYGGGGDEPEGHTIGLDGALGIAHEPWTLYPQPAGFAAHAKKVVILVTDAPARQQPTIEDVAGRLRAAGVAVAALVVSGTTVPYLRERAERDLRELATRTVAVAKRSADCDGDGRRDLVRGSALVCPLDTGAKGDHRGFAEALYARFWG